jgi:hypothetical protein
MRPLQPIEPSLLQDLTAQGNLVLEQPPEVQLSLAQDPLTSRELLKVLVNRADAAVADVARLHVNWAGELTDWHAEIDAVFQTAQLGQNDRLAVELLKLGPVPLEFLSEWVPANVLIQALKNPHMPLRYRLKLLERLAQEPTLEPRLQVAESPELPFAVLEQLVGDLELPVRLATKYNPSCPPALVELVEGQQAIAADWQTDAEQLVMLGQSRWMWLRLSVAQNPSTPVTMLEQLAKDAVFKVQLAVAKNPSTTESILVQLASHPENAIQMAVAQNLNATESILLQLLPSQRSLILQRPNLPAGVLQQLFDEAAHAQNPSEAIRGLYYVFFQQPHTPEAVLHALSQWDVEAIRADLVLKNNYKAQTLEIIEGWVSQQLEYLVQVARHRNVSAAILERLAQCPNPRVRMAVEQNPLRLQRKQRSLSDIPNLDKDLMEALARDVNTRPNLLVELAQSSDEIVRYYVAKNTTTPPETLVQLARDSDIQVRETALKNASTPLIEEHQAFLLSQYAAQLAQEAIDERVRLNELLARRPYSTYALAQVLEKGDRNAKITAARNSKTPINVLEQLAQDPDETVRSVLIDSQTIPLSLRLSMTRDASVNIRCGLARKHTYRDTPTEVLELLANDESEKVRALVAANSCTPTEVLLRLGNDPSLEVKSNLASNPNTPTNILNRLGLEEDIFNVRNPNTPGIVLAHAVNAIRARQRYDYTAKDALSQFLKHPVKGSQMPAETLAELAHHSNEAVRYRVAQHPNTPTSALEHLANDDYVPTIRAVVDNPNTPPHILEQLATSLDVTTRLGVVRNANTPPRALAEIVQSSVTSGNAPNRTVDTLKSAFPGDQNDVLREIACKPQVPLEALEILARREFITPPVDPNSILPPRSNDDIIRSLVYNPSLTPALLGILTQDPCVDVRVALLRHSNLTIELWHRLTEDNAVSVRSAIAASQQAPITVLASLASDADVEVRQKLAANPNTPVTLLHQLAQDSDLTVRSVIATNASASIPLLEQLAQDEKVEVRRVVAQNPNTPASIREALRDLAPPSPTPSVSPTLRSLSRLYNPNTDDLAAILAEYAQSKNAFVRLVTLLHPLTPVEVLEQGARSQSWLERYAAAENSATPAPIRQQLAQDGNRIVRAVAHSSL